jgi:hypothetical protein
MSKSAASVPASNIITKYEVLFALRTGVTIIVPKIAAFNGGTDSTIHFNISPDNAHDIIIQSGSHTLLLKGMKKNHLDAAIEQGFILFYEMEDEDIVRCTRCAYQSPKKS